MTLLRKMTIISMAVVCIGLGMIVWSSYIVWNWDISRVGFCLAFGGMFPMVIGGLLDPNGDKERVKGSNSNAVQ